MADTRTNEPICTICGHPRSHHGEEPPYECCGLTAMSLDYCQCKGFSYVPQPATTEKGPKQP